MQQAVSSAIHFHFSDRDPGENQLLRFSLIDAVQAMEWRSERSLTQEEINALNTYLSICERNQIDYHRDTLYPWLHYG